MSNTETRMIERLQPDFLPPRQIVGTLTVTVDEDAGAEMRTRIEHALNEAASHVDASLRGAAYVRVTINED